MLAMSKRRSHPRFCVDHRSGLRGFPDAARAYQVAKFDGMWTVTTTGDLPDEHERRAHDTSAAAWSDYWGRILELEIHGYRRDGPETVEYGRGWEHGLRRDGEQISVRIELAE